MHAQRVAVPKADRLSVPLGILVVLRRVAATVSINPADGVGAVAGGQRPDAAGRDNELLGAERGKATTWKAEGPCSPNASLGRGLQILNEIPLILRRQHLRNIAGRLRPTESGTAFPTTVPIGDRLDGATGAAIGLLVTPGILFRSIARRDRVRHLRRALASGGRLPCVR